MVIRYEDPKYQVSSKEGGLVAGAQSFWFMCVGVTYQCDVNGELHSDTHWGDQDDHGDGAQLDANQTHDAKQLYRHHGQDKHLMRGNRKKELETKWFLTTDILVQQHKDAGSKEMVK